MKITIKSIFENVLFEHTCENNTLLKTLKEALKEDIDLKYVNLSGAKLSNAALNGADLRYADLSGAKLSNAALNGADLRYADLSSANLLGADLSGADLLGADLSGADLLGADLSGADLSGAKLRHVDLSGAKLRYADLKGADLSNADLNGSDTTNTRLPIYSKWDFSIENDILNIGCKTKTFSEWKKWFEESEEEFSTERNTEDFKRIQAMFYAYEAYYNFLNK